MDTYELVKSLVNIPSVTGDEAACARFIQNTLETLGFQVEAQPVSSDRFNLLATSGRPRVVLSTHMDTVPPFIPAREDADFIYGRGSCDAKGILAAQVAAGGRLLQEGVEDFGLLFLVGEETTSEGARAANLAPRGSEYLINGEPTDNTLVIGTRGMLWFRIEAEGRMSHSAYPERGESAIEKLLDVLADVRRMPLPHDPVFGTTHLNIGLISGGRAPNVIADRAQADVMFRTVPAAEGSAPLRDQVRQIVDGRCELTLVRESPWLRMEAVEGFETRVVPFCTDLPSLGNWGRPLLIGPGSIHDAHTEGEKVAKTELTKAVEIYVRLVRKLLER
jgi:acetylornithine deacetylase